MKQFKLEQSQSEYYSNQTGLAIIGQCLEHYTCLEKDLSQIPQRHGISHSDIVKSYLGLLCIGKTDFEAIAPVKADPFFKDALGIDRVPSTESLRQRMDRFAELYEEQIDRNNLLFLKTAAVPITPLSCGHVALDMDVFPMDNSGTKKEGVEYTYKGHDGYAPLGAYLGNEGWNLACELRRGSQHSQNGFPTVLKKVLESARELTSSPLLVRLDSAHDAAENMVLMSETQGVDYIVKWNPRGQDWVDWQNYADDRHIKWHEPRFGKQVALFRVTRTLTFEGKTVPAQLIVRVTKRTAEADGQLLNFTLGELEGWWTSLDQTNKDVIALYQDHATSEQFHSEIKSDLDLERLPSGKFATNDLVLSMGALAYNILRWIGQKALLGDDAPIRHIAKRRRIKTVIQEIILVASRLLQRSRQSILRFGFYCPAYPAFNRLYREITAG